MSQASFQALILEFIMYYSFQGRTTIMELDHHQLLHCRSEPASLEDDLYYAELERQILLLTADDDEDVDDHNGSVFGGKTLKPLISTTTKHAWSADVAAFGTDYLVLENYDGNHRGFAGTAPWQKSNGTGVFIPQTTKSLTNSHHHSYTGGAGRMNYGRKKKRQMEYKNRTDQCVSSSGCNKRERRNE